MTGPTVASMQQNARDPRWPTLDETQLARVEAFVQDEWVVVDDPESFEDPSIRSHENLRALLAAVTSPLEIHAMAANFNWDCGADSVLRVLEHPLTDRSTVLLAYWRSGPRFYEGVLPSEMTERDAFDDVLALHRMLEAREDDAARIPFDPSCDDTADGYDWTVDYGGSSRHGAIYKVPASFERPALPLDPATRARLVATRRAQ